MLEYRIDTLRSGRLVSTVLLHVAYMQCICEPTLDDNMYSANAALRMAKLTGDDVSRLNSHSLAC